jgi:S-adenosylmethionine:tRNA ribosyltransferase-isomerase
MKLKDFYFELPEELIAQTPIENRDHSRLLILNKNNGNISEKIFKDILDEFHENDCLILNNSKVIPARLYGIKRQTNAKIEVVLLKQIKLHQWEVLIKPGKKAQVGAIIDFGEGLLSGEIIEITEGGNRIINFSYEGNFYDLLDKIGNMPLPPYIKVKLEDKNRYQTVYAKENGSAAAPTAGLHFTNELLEKLKNKGVKIGYVTLHVGLGTFRPVKVSNITEHLMHSEHYFLPRETADIINETKKNGGKVIAVGTTSCRTLETVGANEIKECEGWTDIFIYPGYGFKVIDALITNFHLPESTLIMLVSAFGGTDYIKNAYEYAIKNKFRFFSFGDAMMIY